MRCLIFCAGEMDDRRVEILPGDLVIAADGGLRAARRLGIQPDIVLGDFDSLDYVPENGERHPVEKDDTDTMLAVRRGLELGYREFLLYGSLDGPRLDHTVANFQTLRFLADRGAKGILIGVRQCAAVVKEGRLRFPGQPEGKLSVFAQGGDAEGVTIRGAYYSLEDGALSCGFPLGVSNHFTGQEAEISVKKGCLLVLWEGGSLPEAGCI